MNILPKQESVARVVTAPERIWLDVGGIQQVQHVGVGQSTLTFVHIGDDYPECALPQSRQHGLGFAVAKPLVPQFSIQNWHGTRFQTELHFSPESLSDLVIGGISLVALNRRVPAGNWEPFFTFEEERTLQEDAAD